jgi:prepilin-type N-terminal cleavage/methylation domain-containing protein
MDVTPLKRAFSLVELSIVLVILGLLVGGVLSGQSLIRAAELRNVATEYNEIVTATQSFKDKYFALPGDMPNATRFWLRQGGLGGYNATCVTNSGAAVHASTQQGACDGNGDGKVELFNVLQVNEDAQFWQHLKMAGLMNIKVLQSAGDAGIGINFGSPRSLHNSRLPRGLWGALYYPPTTGQFVPLSTGRVGSNLNLLMFGAPVGNTGAPSTRLLKPEEAWNIDSKIDDGKSTQGTLRATLSGTVWDNCRSGNDYALSDTQEQCSIVFLNPF